MNAIEMSYENVLTMKRALFVNNTMSSFLSLEHKISRTARFVQKSHLRGSQQP